MGQTTLQRTFPFWQLHMDLDSSPALGLKIIHSQSSELRSGGLIHNLRLPPRSHLPQTPHHYPFPTASFPHGPPQPLKKKNNSCNFGQRKLIDAHKPASQGGGCPGMLEGGHQAVCELASREIRAATIFGESHNSVYGKGSRAGQFRGSGLSFPFITTMAFMGSE